MPDLRHSNENRQDAQRGQVADRSASQKQDAGKVAGEMHVRDAAQDLRQQVGQSNAAALKELESSSGKLQRFAGSQDALK